MPKKEENQKKSGESPFLGDYAGGITTNELLKVFEHNFKNKKEVIIVVDGIKNTMTAILDSSNQEDSGKFIFGFKTTKIKKIRML